MGNRMDHGIIVTMNSVQLIILIALAFLSIGRGNAIQCFVCNSKSDPRCADPIQTDWQGSDQQSESEDSDESNEDSLLPVECHLAVKYSAGIEAVSDLFRRFGHARLGSPDLWLATSASLSSNAAPSYNGNIGGYNKGYGGKGYRGGYGSSLTSYGGPWDRYQDESMGCHKVVYTDRDGDSVVDRGCVPGRVANMEPCSALDSATTSDDNGNSGSNGIGGSNSGYKNGFGSGHGGGGNGGNFDMSQISPEFCEVCNDDDGCNGVTQLNGANWIFIICLLSILNGYQY